VQLRSACPVGNPPVTQKNNCQNSGEAAPLEWIAFGSYLLSGKADTKRPRFADPRVTIGIKTTNFGYCAIIAEGVLRCFGWGRIELPKHH
jgi:hypothetical protein